MIKNVKSYFFIRLIFSCITERQKLKLFRYNKSLQNFINISIINYRHFSGKYIIYISNTIGKEYNGYTDKLIFVGEYKNEQKNGKGKVFDYSGNLKFEGEYLNGKRNGKGKEYYNNSPIKFEGEYLNAQKNGKGTEYYDTGRKLFEGKYLNNKKLIGN